MSKYLFLIKTKLSAIAVYRVDMLFKLIASLIEIAVMVSLWSLTTKNDSGLNELLTYYVLFFGVYSFCTFFLAREIAKGVNTGRINNNLVKPIDFLLSELASAVTGIVVRTLLPVIFTCMLIIFLPGSFGPKDWNVIPIFLVMIVLGAAMWQVIVVIIGLLSFWISEITGFSTVFDLVMSFLVGRFIPAYYFPRDWQNTLKLTPFPYMASFSVDIYQGRVDWGEIYTGLVVLLCWLLLGVVIIKLQYRSALRRYEAYG